MARWRVRFAGKLLSTIGTVEVSDEEVRNRKGGERVRIPPARLDFVRVTQVSEGDR